jgi:hypothetical protein
MTRSRLLCSRIYFLSTLSGALSSFSTTCPAPSLTKMASKEEYEPGTHSVAYVTAPNDETAKKIAKGLVENKLAACVNLIPQITSM